MKKVIVLLTSIIFILVSFTAVYADENDGIPYKSEDLKIQFTIPSSWSGKYKIIEQGTKIDFFYKVKDTQYGSNGYLFSIKRYSIGDEHKYNHIKYVSVNKVRFITGDSFDMNINHSDLAEYNKLLKDKNLIIKSIKSLEEDKQPEDEKLITSDECLKIIMKALNVTKPAVKKYTSSDKKSYTIDILNVDSEIKTKKDSYYCCHQYQEVFNYPNDHHIATKNWYYVSKNTGKVYDGLGLKNKFEYIGVHDPELN